MKKKLQTEKQIQDNILKYLSDNGAFATKIEAGRQKNTVDIFGSYKGFAFYIEVKKEGVDPYEECTKLQRFVLDKAFVIGGAYTLATNDLNDIITLLSVIDKRVA